jgi:hypothetical protein
MAAPAVAGDIHVPPLPPPPCEANCGQKVAVTDIIKTAAGNIIRIFIR